MPGKQVGPKKYDQYKKLLLKLKEDLLKDIKTIANESNSGDGGGGDVAGHALHMADVATDMYDKEFNLGLASNDRELLHRIEVALNKIEERTYGICVECEKSILSARLKALPYTETCLKCQEKIEAEQERRIS